MTATPKRDRPPNRYYDRNNRDHRDYKRRLSPSPPPYRDRRPYSLPQRRSPPYSPFKLSRREDGGYGDWDSGRGGYGNPSITGNMQRYQEYKSECISTQKPAYFDAHKDEEWRNELARKVAKDCLLDLHSGSLDLGPGANASSMNKSGQTSEPTSEDETDDGRKRRQHGRTHAKEADISATPTAHPASSEPGRIQIDVELAQALIKKLDSGKGIEDNILSKDDTDKMNRIDHTVDQLVQLLLYMD